MPGGGRRTAGGGRWAVSGGWWLVSGGRRAAGGWRWKPSGGSRAVDCERWTAGGGRRRSAQEMATSDSLVSPHTGTIVSRSRDRVFTRLQSIILGRLSQSSPDQLGSARLSPAQLSEVRPGLVRNTVTKKR